MLLAGVALLGVLDSGAPRHAHDLLPRSGTSSAGYCGELGYARRPPKAVADLTLDERTAPASDYPTRTAVPPRTPAAMVGEGRVRPPRKHYPEARETFGSGPTG